MSYDSYLERKPGLKRKAADDLQEAQPKKLKREGELDEVEIENPDLLKDEIDSLQRELDMLDAELKKQGADIEMSDIPVEPGVDFSEDVDDSEIQVDDDSTSSQRGLSQSRSRRIPRPNRNFSNYEVEPEDQRAVVPPVVSSPPLNAHYGSTSSTKDSQNSQPVVIKPPVRRPPTPSKIKVSRGRGGAAAPAAASSGVTNSGGRNKGTGRGRGGKWKPVLPAPAWGIPRKSNQEPTTTKKGPDPMTICGRILRDLTKHKHAWVFLQPVDAKALGLHDYHKVIKRPMDLGTIQAKLTNSQYSNVNEFAEDVRLTFRNAMLYNPPHNDVHLMGKSLLQIFEDKLPKAVEVESADPAMKKLHLEQTVNRYKNFEDKLKNQLESAQKELEKSRITEITDVSPSLRPKDSLPDAIMEYDEKCKLSQSINTLGLRFMKGLFQIFEEEKPEYLKSESEIIDVETDRLPNALLRRLEAYVADCRALEQQNRSSLGSSNSGTTQNTNKAPTTSTTTTATTTTTTTTTTTSITAISSTATTATVIVPPSTPTTATTTTTATKTTPQSTQGGKQPGAKKEDSDESSSSSSDSSSSDESSDSDSEDNANTDKKSKKNKGGHVTPASITITTTAHANGAPNGAASTATTTITATTTTTTPTPVTTAHTTIPGIAVMTPKPFILPTQKEEKQVVIMNQDSWSGLVSGGNSNAAIIPVSVPQKPAEIPDLAGRKLSSDASEAAAALASIHPVSTPIIPPVAPSVVSPVLSVPIQPIRPPTAAVPSITPPVQPPTQQLNHAASPQIGAIIPPTSGNAGDSTEFGGALWEDMKKRMALNKQREKDRAEIEAELQRQQEEEKKRIEREIQARKQAEEERKRKEQEEERQRQLEREREVERLREEERARREKAGPSVNLTSQSEIMANFERSVFVQGGTPLGLGMGMGMGNLDVTSLLGLKRRDDDED